MKPKKSSKVDLKAQAKIETIQAAIRAQAGSIDNRRKYIEALAVAVLMVCDEKLTAEQRAIIEEIYDLSNKLEATV